MYEKWKNCFYTIVKIIASNAPIFVELKFFSEILRLFYAEFNLNLPMNKERRIAVYIVLSVRNDCLLADIHEARLPMTTWGKELLQ
jgi:hypothetical protein